MSAERVILQLYERIAFLEKVVNRQETRMNNMFREASVKEVDYSKGLAIVDAHGVESKEVPWMEPAGDIVEWTPVSAGQRVMLISPGGQTGRGFIIPGGFTDAVPQPHNQGAEKRVKIGGTQWTMSSSGLLLEVGGASFSFTGEGFRQTGGTITHDGVVIDKTHKHLEVAKGGDKTGVPE